MKLGEIVIHIGYYNFTKLYQNRMKDKKLLLIACFSVQNFKVSVELWKLYIVHTLLTSELKNCLHLNSMLAAYPVCGQLTLTLPPNSTQGTVNMLRPKPLGNEHTYSSSWSNNFTEPWPMLYTATCNKLKIWKIIKICGGSRQLLAFLETQELIMKIIMTKKFFYTV